MTEIYKINENNTITQKISLLNDMILAINGKIEEAKFNKNEIDALYTDLGSGYQHKFLREVLLGHTLATYTGWSHIKAESGYSIWKYTPTNYSYNILNQLYFDDKVLSNEGLATSETITTFNKVYTYSGSFVDNTTEASTEEGTAFDLLSDTDEYVYIGNPTTFGGIKFEFYTRGANYTLAIDYYGTAGWTELEIEDNTSDFESDGNIIWSIPVGWNTVAINGVTQYWIRIRTTTSPITTAKAYYIVPSESVIGLLALSSTEFFNEEWKWCTYGSDIYVTIRNTGNPSYEGSYFITSASSTANLQAFLISNHEFKLSHLDSTYS